MLLRLIPDYMKNMLLPVAFEQEFIKSPYTLSAPNSGILTPSNANTKNNVLKLSYPVIDNPPLYVARGVFDQVKFLLPIFYLPPIEFPKFSYYLVDKEQDEKLESYLNHALSKFNFNYNENIYAIYITPTSNGPETKTSDSIHKSLMKNLSDFSTMSKNEIEILTKRYKELELKFNNRLKVENEIREKHKIDVENHKKEVESLDKKYWDQINKITDILLNLNPEYIKMKAEYEELLRIKEEERKRKEEQERKRLEEIKRKEEEARRIATEKAAEERRRQLLELREKERQVQLEKERKAAEAARKAEEEKKRLEEEKKRAEKEKKEQEERERQKLLEKKREEERMKNPGLAPCPEGKKKYDSALGLINSINNQVIPHLKSNPKYKDFRLDMKLTIQGKFNQITSSRSKINSFAQIINRELDKARSMGEDFYKLALNLFGKSAVKNAETECGPTPAHAYRSALLIVLVLENHPDCFEYVYSRMIKNCPYIAPYTPRATKDTDKATYFKSINRGFSDNELEDETVYSERMAGITAVYAAICQTSTGHGQPPYNMGHLWTWLASTLNSPAARVTPDLINSALTIAGNKMKETYGFQFYKILDYIRFIYMDKLSKDSVSANSQLKVLLNNYVKNLQFPPLEGSEIDY